jgi:signal transduction histidine kinase
MSIVKRLVEAHGGQIALGDNALEGAEFVIMIPR